MAFRYAKMSETYSSVGHLKPATSAEAYITDTAPGLIHNTPRPYICTSLLARGVSGCASGVIGCIMRSDGDNRRYLNTSLLQALLIALLFIFFSSPSARLCSVVRHSPFTQKTQVLEAALCSAYMVPVKTVP